jgi:hypothetical protein
MRNVGVRFLLHGGVYVDVVLLESEARGIMDGFHKGTLKEIIGQPDHVQGPWVIRTSNIQAIQMGQLQVSHHSVVPQIGLSGIK